MLVFIFITKLFILFKPNSEEYCRSTRLSNVGEAVGGGAADQAHGDSAKFQAGQGHTTTDAVDTNELNLNCLENDEIRVEFQMIYFFLVRIKF
jgi:hypothetical protein